MTAAKTEAVVKIKKTGHVLPEIALAMLVATGLTACATPPSDYNTAGSTGQLIRQATGFDGNICYYNNGVTTHTQGNCPPSATSTVYQRSQ